MKAMTKQQLADKAGVTTKTLITAAKAAIAFHILAGKSL